jgi:arsenate reductase
MSTITIYHNPHCSKSRQTLELLEDRGLEPLIIEYLKEPPDAATLRGLLDRLGLAPRELMRKREAPYAELGLDRASLKDAELIDAMCRHPVLIERPIVVHGTRAALGRPPESVLAIL